MAWRWASARAGKMRKDRHAENCRAALGVGGAPCVRSAPSHSRSWRRGLPCECPRRVARRTGEGRAPVPGPSSVAGVPVRRGERRRRRADAIPDPCVSGPCHICVQAAPLHTCHTGTASLPDVSLGPVISAAEACSARKGHVTALAQGLPHCSTSAERAHVWHPKDRPCSPAPRQRLHHYTPRPDHRHAARGGRTRWPPSRRGAPRGVAVGGLRRDSAHDSAGRRAPRGQQDLSPRRHWAGRRRCLLRRRRRRAAPSRSPRSGRRQDDAADFVASAVARRLQARARSGRPAPRVRGAVEVAIDTIDVRPPAVGTRRTSSPRTFQPRARRRTFRRTPGCAPYCSVSAGASRHYTLSIARRSYDQATQDRGLWLMTRAGPWACLRRCPLQA